MIWNCLLRLSTWQMTRSLRLRCELTQACARTLDVAALCGLGHDTSEPPRDRLLLGELQHARIWASIHKGWGLSLDRDREFHRATMRRVIGEPVLTELSVAETFARARAARPFDMGVYANQLLRGMAA